ncbi:hypothetical protein N824_21500 [Pedobacter sp. V48]|nr:hypothetical protein N824_21500 [Pedobacter sp. V48]
MSITALPITLSKTIRSGKAKPSGQVRHKYKLVGADVILIPIKYYFNLNLDAVPSEEKNAWANSYLI